MPLVPAPGGTSLAVGAGIEERDSGMRCSSVYSRAESDVGPSAVPELKRTSLQGGAALSVTLHDVAPATQARCERAIAQILAVADVPFTLLVVPRYHHAEVTPAFERWIEERLRAGDELVLHGFTHLDEAPVDGGVLERLRRRAYTAGEGEFAALATDAATARFDAGRDWFRRRGWPLRGFVAPAWLLGPGAWRAFARQPFDYTCTLRHLVRRPLGDDGIWYGLEAWSIVYSTRAAWRRQLSRMWTGALAWRQQRGAWMRFELHPDDFGFASIRAATLRALTRAVATGRAPLTLGGISDRLACF